jgi:DNA polymerase-3 subunit gamma/tau
MNTESHLALYRKYRPQTFSDVVGQEQIVSLLEKSIDQDKISHAYLFCGGRGTGKTTVARIFAKDIGCNPEDIIEIDAASNRGIDEIRELREAVRTAPFSSRYKVYIVDEAHMLTKEAANAFLKTLEEPPSHVVFILATTDPEKLPQTIVSRCQKVIFKEPTITMLAQRLVYVADKEGKVLPEEVAGLVSRHGNGSYRDALGFLEQVLRISGKEIKQSDVEVFLGEPSEDVGLIVVEAFCVRDIQKVISVLHESKKTSQNALRVYDDIIECVRKALLIRVGVLVSSDATLTSLATSHAKVLNSALILELLAKRDLVKSSDAQAFVAVQAILLHSIESSLV